MSGGLSNESPSAVSRERGERGERPVIGLAAAVGTRVSVAA